MKQPPSRLSMSFAQVAHWRVKENDESLCRSPHDPPPPHEAQLVSRLVSSPEREERHTSESQLEQIVFSMEWRTNLLESHGIAQ